MKQQYDSYKDSGVEWIGEIPEHWHIMRLKYIFDNLDYLREPISSSERERKNPQYDYYGASGVIDKIDHYNVEDTVLLIGEDGANLVMRNLPLIYKATGKFWVNNHAHILKPKINYNYSYMAYILESGDYTLYITGSAQPKLSQDNLNQFLICIPPLAEQEAIAAWLDEKCGEIDKVIDGEKRRITLLEELKQSVITEAVTHGLNPDAPLKPSGVDWIGDIPEHWKVCRLNRILDGIQDGTHATLQRVDYGHPLLSAKNVFEDGIHISENESYISSQDYTEIISNGFPKKGDIALCCVATIGRGCIYPFDYPLAFQRSVTFLRINHHFSNSFILYYLRSISAKAQFDTYAKTSAQSGVYMGDLKRFFICLPSLAEQNEIALWLDAKCGAIDADIAKTKRKIELLQEYKQSLITEAVTGKRKVL